MSDDTKTGEDAAQPSMPSHTVLSAVSLLRTTQQHHVSLSAMADQKAGFLIGGSVVLLGLVLGQIDDGASAGLIIAGITAVVTLGLSIVAVMPRYYRAAAHHERPNPLFFGVFAHMTEDEFMDEALGLMATDESVRRAMLRDIYQMGKGLNATKFRYLAYAFRVALVGMGLAFAVALGGYVL